MPKNLEQQLIEAEDRAYKLAQKIAAVEWAWHSLIAANPELGTSEGNLRLVGSMLLEIARADAEQDADTMHNERTGQYDYLKNRDRAA
jgi:hypothetical protein